MLTNVRIVWVSCRSRTLTPGSDCAVGRSSPCGMSAMGSKADCYHSTNYDCSAHESGHLSDGAGRAHKSRLVSSGWSLSALPPKADIRQRIEHVYFVPMQTFARQGETALCLRQARLCEIEGVAVEDCRVSKGVSEPPRLQRDRRVDLHHFHYLCSGVGHAAKAHVGDRQE